MRETELPKLEILFHCSAGKIVEVNLQKSDQFSWKQVDKNGLENNELHSQITHWINSYKNRENIAPSLPLILPKTPYSIYPLCSLCYSNNFVWRDPLLTADRPSDWISKGKPSCWFCVW